MDKEFELDCSNCGETTIVECNEEVSPEVCPICGHADVVITSEGED